MSVEWMIVNNLRYEDDNVLLAENHAELQELIKKQTRRAKNMD
jgi:hypothetical protein